MILSGVLRQKALSLSLLILVGSTAGTLEEVGRTGKLEMVVTVSADSKQSVPAGTSRSIQSRRAPCSGRALHSQAPAASSGPLALHSVADSSTPQTNLLQAANDSILLLPAVRRGSLLPELHSLQTRTVLQRQP